jgi:secreted trypsin-like serine protease
MNRFNATVACRNVQGFLLGMVAFFIMPSQAIIIRHDQGASAYQAREADFPAIFFLELQDRRKFCVATLIHEQWAITAAHCLQQTSLGSSLEQGHPFAVKVAGQESYIGQAVVHPEFNPGASNEVDMALLRFAAPLAVPRPISLSDYESQQGDIVTLLGWGYFGLGTTGRQRSDGVFRRAQNRLTVAGSRLEIRFDDPRISAADVLDLEGMPSLGDSGGPALHSTEAGYALAGIAIGEVMQAGFTEETQGNYGSIAVYEHIYHHLEWIAEIIGTAQVQEKVQE